MPQATREIKRRIRSIKNTRQITKAMELVSASKMRKAVQNVLATRTYAGLAWDTLLALAERTDVAHHPLLQKRTGNRTAVILISSNRGLCGGFNHQLTSKVSQYLHDASEESIASPSFVVAGTRGRDIVFREGYTIVAEFPKVDVTSQLEEIRPLAQLVLNDYLAGKYDRVVVAYTDFISPITQKPRVRELLPLASQADAELGAARIQGVVQPASVGSIWNYEYQFEPTPAEVLDELLPRLLEVQLYQAFLESNASEHSARMLAMRNASDAAKDMIDGLTLAFNQARQAGITQELAEIVGGTVAVEG